MTEFDSTDEELPIDEAAEDEVDIEPYEGAPDDGVPWGRDDGSQDDEEPGDA